MVVRRPRGRGGSGGACPGLGPACVPNVRPTVVCSCRVASLLARSWRCRCRPSHLPPVCLVVLQPSAHDCAQAGPVGCVVHRWPRATTKARPDRPVLPAARCVVTAAATRRGCGRCAMLTVTGLDGCRSASGRAAPRSPRRPLRPHPSRSAGARRRHPRLSGRAARHRHRSRRERAPSPGWPAPCAAQRGRRRRGGRCWCWDWRDGDQGACVGGGQRRGRRRGY